MSRTTLYRLIGNNEIKCTKNGTYSNAAVRIDAHSVAIYLGCEPKDDDMPAIPRLYTLDEVAELTNFAAIWLKREARAERYEHVHRGKRRYMTAEQVEKLVKQYTVGAATPAAEIDPLAATRERVERMRERRESRGAA